MSAPAEVDRATTVRSLAEHHLASDRGPLLPILHEVVTTLGYVDREDIPVIADVLNLSVADVHGVVSFYHDFRTTPPAAHTIKLCRAEACQAMGADTLFARATTDAATGAYGPDVALEEIFCLGNCALSPAGMIDGRLHGCLDGDRIVALTEEWRS
ncbi:MAG: NAD(P)H-dependent oxidoreductase subunit E [Nocardioidaceae bacterium]